MRRLLLLAVAAVAFLGSSVASVLATSPGSAGLPVTPTPLAPKQVKEWARRHVGKRLKLQVLSLGLEGQSLAILLAYQPLPEWNEDTVVPEDVRGGARLFVFSSSEGEPAEVRNHGFLTPDDDKVRRERPYVNCGEAEIFYLAAKHDPAVVAQSCTELDEYVTRFLVFGAANPQSPAIGKAVRHPGGITIGTDERFVPAKEAWLGKPSRFRGDGKTLVDGEEFKGKGNDIVTRSYRIEWDGKALRKVEDAWHRLR
jgi:hypothetical protein